MCWHVIKIIQSSVDHLFYLSFIFSFAYFFFIIFFHSLHIIFSFQSLSLSFKFLLYFILKHCSNFHFSIFFNFFFFNFFPFSNSYFIPVSCPVAWGCKIHWLCLCRGVRPPPPMSVLDMILNIWWWGSSSAGALGNAGTPLLSLFPGPLWPLYLVSPNRALSMG